MRYIKELLLFGYLFIICFYYVIENSFFILNGLGILFSFVVILDIVIRKKPIKVSFFLVLLFINILWFLSSYFWSTNPNEAFSIIRIIISIFIFSVCLYNHLDKIEKIENILFYFVTNTFLITMYALIMFDYTRFGLRRFDSAGNPNYISILVLIGLIISLYFIIKKGKKLYILFWPVGLTVIFLGGSRKVIFGIIISIIVMAILNNIENPKKTIKSGIIIIFSITIIYQLLINVELLKPTYERMSSLVSSISGSEVADGSFNERNLMIKYGIEYISEKPLIGHGVGQYRITFAKEAGVGRESYSHNNFIELGVNNGLFGLLLYYSMYLYLILQFIKLRLVQDYLSKIMLVILSVIFIFGYGEVQYYSYQYYLLLIITAKLFHLCKTDRPQRI